MASGTGYLGGYGTVLRSAYATPAELGAKPWALDFDIESGWPSYPTKQRVALNLRWQTNDWDPGLRYWSLPFDEGLQEWLQDVDLASPAVLAAREFASHHNQWRAEFVIDANDPAKKKYRWIKEADLAWQTQASAVDGELSELEDLMQRERAQYLDEAWLQSDNLPAYVIHFLGTDTPSKPWTVELMRCALSIGNLVYMHYKSHFKRVRPSTLCPGLVPPWGPPRHPAFPSGHSFLGHFMALLLLEIPGLAQRYGVFEASPGVGKTPTRDDFKVGYGEDMKSPLLWLAWRLARNRERIGVHYRSDSSASRSLAMNVWRAVLHEDKGEVHIAVPTLRDVLERAKAEWS